MYRGREGMWSWIGHRVGGIGIFVFLLFHIVDTMMVGFGPEHYNAFVKFYRMPAFIVGEVILVAAVLFHALNGLRIILIDFWSEAVRYQRQLVWAELVLFALLFIPTAYLMLSRL